MLLLHKTFQTNIVDGANVEYLISHTNWTQKSLKSKPLI